MLALLPTLRLFRIDGRTVLESVVAERSIDVDDDLVRSLRALSAGPVASLTDLAERVRALGGSVDRAAIGQHVALLSELDLIDRGEPGGSTARLWAALAERTPAFPIVDAIELTNACPCTCAMCPTGTARMTRPRAFMDPALFRQIVDELRAAGGQEKALTLHNLGESLLHQELAALVADATRAGLRTEVAGNPGNLTLERYRDLERAGLSRLVLDVDGLDQTTLERVRGPGARGDVAFANLEAILAHRAAQPRSTPQLILQMIRLASNAHQHAAFLDRYARRAILGVEAYLKEVDANTVERPANAADERGLPIVVAGRAKRPYLCRAPWRSVVVLVNGDVVPCCHDANGALVLGNLRRQTLREIWGAEPIRGLRARLSTATTTQDEPCFGCAHRADRSTLPALDEIPDEPLHW